MSGMGRNSPLRRAEIIAVGSELLVPPRLDTNSLFITEKLNDYGIEVRAKAIVGDRREDLEAVLRAALSRTELVVLCGGLGPTDDDLTREAVAAVTGRELREDASVLDGIRQRFAARGARMPDINRRQAMVPAGADVIPNAFGTAPGLWLEHDGRLLLLLPGPPAELKPMLARIADERLAPVAGASRLERRVLHICGRTESEVDELAAPVYSRWLSAPAPVSTTVLTAPAQVELHLSAGADSKDDARARLSGAAEELAALFGDDVFSTDGRPLEEVVGRLLRDRGWRVGVAESCTGGLISARLTDVAGSSDYVGFNAVCYSNAAKTEVLGVPAALIGAHGAVSEPVALAMADGIRRRASCEIGIGVTGIAGPAGGSDEKPVGTVVVGVTTADVRHVRTYRFPTGRARVRQFAAQMALDLARRTLLGVPPGRAFVVASGGGGRP
ncbi:MAG: competence/damage-inducible protein A [Vicinamibacterales bacterium]|nr:competence/damage-inducible protein A [Vicinamibacterales bacterium]